MDGEGSGETHVESEEDEEQEALKAEGRNGVKAKRARQGRRR